MGIGLVRMDADRCPDVGIAFGRAKHIIPFALPGGNVQEAGYAPRSGGGEHFLLTFGKAGVVQVAVAIDQPHFAASAGSASRSSRGNSGCG